MALASLGKNFQKDEPVPKLFDCALKAHGFGKASDEKSD
jgi:hypothetical protein